MIYRISAELVLILHFCFVVFAVFGGLLVLRWRAVIWLHLPALIWGISVEYFLWTCPLTSFENSLRELGGEAGYAGGFVDHYISAVLYPDITSEFRVALGFLLFGFNLLVYLYLFRQRLFPRRL